MSNNVLVSVIVPANNAGIFLAETLRSVQAQTYQRWECLIVDDASTDNTRLVAEEAVRRDSRFRIVCHQKKQGVSATRNTGIAHAKGEWIAFLDADDIWMPEKTARQLQLLETDPAANFLFTNWNLWDGTTSFKTVYRKRRKFVEKNSLRGLTQGNRYNISTLLVRRETLLAGGGFDETLPMMEDWDMWLRIAEKRIHARGVWEPMVLYRQWDGNTSKADEKMYEFAVRVTLKALARPQQASNARQLRKTLIRFLTRLEHPSRLCLLGWHLAATCPSFLGGNCLFKIAQKYCCSDVN